MQLVSSLWDRFLLWGADTAHVQGVWVIIACFLGGLAINAKPQWATIPHELGHAFTALLLGKRLLSINIRRDSSGDAITSEKMPATLMGRLVTFPFRWLRGILVSSAGYLGPFLYAWGMSFLWFYGYSRFAVLLTLILLCFTLLYIRNSFGLFLVLFGVVVLGIICFVNNSMVNQLFSVFLVGGMVAGGVRGVVEAWLVYRQDIGASVRLGREAQHSDARALAHKTFIPQVVWLTFFSLSGLFLSYQAITLVLS